MVRKSSVVLIFIIIVSTSFTAGLVGKTTRPLSTPAIQDEIAAPRPTVARSGRSSVIRVTVSSVMLNVSVRDREANRSILGLQLEDFQVYEDGVLQNLEMTEITNVPYSILLLMDVSGSTYSYRKMMKHAATEFTREIGEKDRIAIACFNSKVRLLQNFTSDSHALTRAISRFFPNGGTAFYDALMTSVDSYMRRVAGRKAIVVFTDGVDNVLEGNSNEGSRTSYKELYSRLQESDTLIYTIFLNSEGKGTSPTRTAGAQVGGGIPRIGRLPIPLPTPVPSPLPIPTPFPNPKLPAPRAGTKPQKPDAEHAAYVTAQEQLKAIAELTGGRMYSPQRLEELSSVYAQVADDLRVQYLLSYTSSNMAQADGWHSIRVEVKNHPEAVVRTRAGYYIDSRPGK